jgi:hypothetical protein
MAISIVLSLKLLRPGSMSLPLLLVDEMHIAFSGIDAWQNDIDRVCSNPDFLFSTDVEKNFEFSYDVQPDRGLLRERPADACYPHCRRRRRNPPGIAQAKGPQ